MQQAIFFDGLFCFGDLNFHFLPKSLYSNAFIEYGRK